MSDKPGEAKSDGFVGTPRPLWGDSDESQRWSIAHARWTMEIEEAEHGRRSPSSAPLVVLLVVLVTFAVLGIWVAGRVVGAW